MNSYTQKFLQNLQLKKFKLILADLANLADDYLIICLIRKICERFSLEIYFFKKASQPCAVICASSLLPLNTIKLPCSKSTA